MLTLAGFLGLDQLRAADPVATITVPSSTVTVGAQNLTASVPVQSGATYQWSITGGTLISGYGNQATTYFSAGTGSSLGLQCIVTNASGTATGSSTLAVVAAPTISSFSAAVASITKGANTTLTASFSGGTASVDNGVGAVTSGTAVTVTPLVSTYYTLTVVNAAGTKVTATYLISVIPPDSTIAATTPITAGAAGTASVPSRSGVTYLWSITNGSLTSGQGTNAIQYTAGTSGTCGLSCTVTTTTGGYSSTGTAPVTIIPAPVISSFTASAVDVAPGGYVTLTPVFSGGNGVISRGIGPVTSGSGIRVYPATYSVDVPNSGATHYILTVTNAAGASTSAYSPWIYIDPAPVIQVTASNYATVGATNTLRAQATVFNGGSSNVAPVYLWTITNGTINLGQGSNAIYVTPTSAGACTATCKVTNPVGLYASASASTTAVAAPAVTSFTASATTVTAGTSVTLTPVFTNGTGEIKSQNGYVGPVQSGQTYTITPTATAVWFLYVTNQAGTYTSQTVQINVNPGSFGNISVLPNVTAGGSCTASVPYASGTTWLWSITNGTITYGKNYYGAGKDSYSITFQPTAVGTCVLTCVVTPPSGSPVTNTANIQVIAAPSVTSFTASANTVAPGTTVTLTPTFTNGVAKIDPGIGGVTSGQPLSVRPGLSTTYTLTVTNAAGTATTATQGITLLGAPDSTLSAPTPVTVGATYSASVPWQSTIGATHVWSITNGTITYNGNQGTVRFVPTAVGTCILTDTVTDASGLSSTGTASIQVIAAPVITKFSALPPVLELGDSGTLTAVFSGGTGQINQGVGPVASGTAVSVSPKVATTYTVTVTNAAGTSVTAQTSLTPTPKALTITPNPVKLPVGTQQAFLALSSEGKTLTPTWSVKESGGGTIQSTGVYAPPSLAGTYHVQAARADAPNVTALAAITVPIQVTLDQPYVTLQPAGTATLHGTVTGTTDTRLVWTATGGTVSPTGTFTAPSTNGIYRVTATSPVDSKAFDTAIIQVGSGQAAVIISPGQAQLAKGGTQTFTALVLNAANPAITWSCSGGTIASGVYTAPNTFGTYTVTAALVSDPTIKDTATVVVPGGTSTGTFTYDANGNMTGDGTRTFEWDAENRLISVTITATGHRSEFGYDGMGRRVMIRELDVVNSTLTETSNKKYLWDGVEIAEERDSTGATVQKRFYSQGFVDSDGTNLYYTRDHLGSIRELTDSTQTVRARYDYDPYGRMTKVSGDRDTVFGYTGHLWHVQSGLGLTLNRSYEANFGRWVSRDPLEESGGINLYNYVGSNPTLWVDPYGLKSCKSCGIIKGPEYDHSGSINGGTHFSWGAHFMNDATHSPSCCEVRQQIQWNPTTGIPHSGFSPNSKPNKWYEDRDQAGKRYGRRSGPYSDPIPGGDDYSGDNYSGSDQPSGFPSGVVLKFRLVVVDVCNGGKRIYTSRVLSVNF